MHTVLVGLLTLASMASRMDELGDGVGAWNAHHPAEQLKDQLLAIKAELVSCRSLQTQMAELQAFNTALSERLTSKDETISELREQLKIAGEKEAEHASRTTELEDEVRILNRPSEEGTNSPPSRELELQNSHLRNALEKAKAELAESARKLQLFEDTEHRLREEADALKMQIKEWQDNLAKSDTERAEIERKVSNGFRSVPDVSFVLGMPSDTRQASEQLNDMRVELSKQANKLRQDQAAEFDNKLHQTVQKKKQAENSLAKITTELVSSKQQQQLLAEQVRLKDDEIFRLTKIQMETGERVEQMQQSLSITSSSEKDSETVTGELHATSEQLCAKEAEIQVLRKDLESTTIKVRALEEALSNAGKAKKDQESSMEALRENLNAALEQRKRKSSEEIGRIRGRLTAAEAAKQEAESNVERLRKRTETILKEHQDKAARDNDGLHQQLAEADAARKESETNLQKVRRKAEDALKRQQEKNRADLGEFQRRVNEAEADKNEAEASIRRMRTDAEMELNRVRSASERERNLLVERARRAEADLEELKRNVREDLEKRLAPKALPQLQSQRAQAGDGVRLESTSPDKDTGIPQKPRRKVDRSSNSVISVPRSSQPFDNSLSRVSLRKEQQVQFGEYSSEPLEDNSLGEFEILDENGVSTVEPGANTERTRLESSLITTFQELNQSMSYPSTSLAVSQPRRASSPLSDVQSVSTPSDVRIVETPQDNRALPAEARVLRQLTIHATTPTRAPPMGQLTGRTQQSSLSSAATRDNPFFDFDRPKSQAPSNTASRMAPSTHQIPSRPNSKPATFSSSPDFVQKDSAASHKVTTYGHTPGQKATDSNPSKRRTSANDTQTGPPDNKRWKENYPQATRRASDRTSLTEIPETQPESQEFSVTLSQSQRQPLPSVPVVRQSRMRSSTQVSKSSTGGNGSRRGGKKSK